jgi:hypothetical protein
VLDVLLGALLAFAGFFTYQSNQEDYHFTRLVHAALGLPPYTDKMAPQTEANVLRIMHKVHAVTNARREQLADLGHPKPGVFWSSDEHLTEPSGACHSYTTVLAKSLRTAGYPIRKVGLERNGQASIHHVLETYVEGRWVLMDAMSDLAFRRPDGRLASAAEVHANWKYYRQQTPPDYNPEYDYSGFYYTNWDRVPGVGALLRAFPALHTWLESRGVSIRFVVLDVYQWFTGASLAGAALLLTVRLWPKLRKWRNTRRQPGTPDRASRGAAAREELSEQPRTRSPLRSGGRSILPL